MTVFRKTQAAFVALALGVGTPLLAEQILLRNRGFEDGVAPWTEVNGSIVCNGTCLPGGAASGTGFAWLGSSEFLTAIEQTVTIPPGYKVAFRMQKVSCLLGGSISLRFVEPTATTSLWTESTRPGAGGCGEGYQDRVVDLASVAGRTGTLRFEHSAGIFENDSSTVFLDDVGLVPPVKADFNHDQHADLILRTDGQYGNQYNTWFMNEGVRTADSFLKNLASWIFLRGADDFNRDGQTDIVVRDETYGGSPGIIYFNGVSPVGGADVSGPGLSVDWQLASTGDFNMDAYPDLVWRNKVTQQLMIWTLQEAEHVGTIIPSPDHAVDANWSVVATLDYNGDGARDFLWYNRTSGKVVFWFMNGDVQRITGQFANPPNAGDANWKVVAAGDYAVGPAGRPGTADIVWRNDNSGKMVLWCMDRDGNRTAGFFTTPASADPPLAWNVDGPR